MSTPPDGGADAAGRLTHLDEHGRARMVDVTAKPRTARLAVAVRGRHHRRRRCRVRDACDGMDPVEAARVAGMQAAKQTSSLIPLCHPIRIDRVSVDVEVTAHRVEITAVTEIVERTGVEMEALTACAIAGLSLVGGLLDCDPDASVEELTLWHKSGGRSGEWQRSQEPAPAS